MENDDLEKLATEKIELGEQLIKQLSELKHIDGIKNVQNKIRQELKFLKRSISSKTIKLNHLLCSNLIYFNCLTKNIFKCNNIKFVDYPLPVSNRKQKQRIDIVCDNGATWIKVIARSSKSLNDVVFGRSEYGTKSILDQAEEYIEAANINQYYFQPPKVIFKFASSIDQELIEKIQEIGVDVVHCDDDEKKDDNDDDNDLNLIKTNKQDSSLLLKDKLNNIFDLNSNINTINLDITTLIAYVSSVSNGGCNFVFKEELLTQQAKWEKYNPVKPLLDKIFNGKTLICCKTAVQSFEKIVEIMGGTNETKRAKDFLKTVQILDDVEIHPDLADIAISGKIKERSLLIFSFGLYHKSLTLTSNEGFIRSTKMKGLNIPVFIHEARALTEIKEIINNS